MKKLIYILLIVFVFISCEESNTIYKKPENLISKEDLIDLMVDIQLAQGAYSVKNKNHERKIDYMSLVYEKYKIDSIQFSKSMKYYITTINEYSEIMNQTEVRLEALRKKVDKERIFEQKQEESKNSFNKIKDTTLQLNK